VPGAAADKFAIRHEEVRPISDVLPNDEGPPAFRGGDFSPAAKISADAVEPILFPGLVFG
jgi:hypothetical protein